MKLRYSLFAVACVALLAACNEDVEKPPVLKGEALTFSASTESAEGGPQIAWRESDAISIFDFKTNNRFQTASSGSVADFEGLALKGRPAYAAMYPYRSGAVKIADGTMSLTIPSNQAAIAGGVDPNHNYAVAYSRDGASLAFKNVAAYLKLTLNGEHSIVSVRLSANGGENIAGPLTVSVSDQVLVTPGEGGSSLINMSGSGLDGVYYIMVTPQTLAEGYTLQLTSGYDMMYKKVVTAPVALARNQVYDLGSFVNIASGEWAPAGPNPTPTRVPGVSFIRATFREGEFNVISEPGFETYPAQALEYRTSWRFPSPDEAAKPGYDSHTAAWVQNDLGGRWYELALQHVALRPQTDYRYTVNAMASISNVYNGVRLNPAGPLREIPGGSWAPSTAWKSLSLDFNAEACYYGEVFAGIWGDPGAYFTVDDFRLIPKGYDKTSMEPVSATVTGTMGNVTYSAITSLGKAVVWKGLDGKLRTALSRFTLNSTDYNSGVALTDAESLSGAVNVNNVVKQGISITPILAPSGGATSIVPNAAFTLGGKTYMHYYAKGADVDENSWNVLSAGFLISEDDGLTWAKTGSTWSGTGVFTSASFCQKDGYLYMAGSKPRRSPAGDYQSNMYVARIELTKEFIDPAQWEYWNGREWSTGDEKVCQQASCCITVGACSEPALVYNPRFDRFMMIYRSARHEGLVYRDADAVDGYWSGEKVITSDDVTGGRSYAPSVLEVTAEGDLLIAAPQL